MKNKTSGNFAMLPREKLLELARKGGLSISTNREHMSRIGKLGVLAKKHKPDRLAMLKEIARRKK